MKNKILELRKFLEELEYDSKEYNTEKIDMKYVIERITDILGKYARENMNRYDVLIKHLSKNRKFDNVYKMNDAIIIKPVQDRIFRYLDELIGKYRIYEDDDGSIYEADGVRFRFDYWSYMNGIVYEIQITPI